MMRAKEILFDEYALSKILKGSNVLANAVATTLGPQGRQVVIEKSNLNPISTKDGAAVADAIELADPFEDAGAQLIKQACFKTMETTGDGSATSAVLAQAMVNEGFKCLVNGMNPVEIKKGMQLAVDACINHLHRISVDCGTTEALTWVATASANGDKALGKLIAEAVKEADVEGTVIFKESDSMTDNLKLNKGFKLEHGFTTSNYLKDSSSQKVTLTDPKILIIEGKLSNQEELLPILDSCANSNSSLLIIADDIDEQIQRLLLTNAKQGRLQCFYVQFQDSSFEGQELLHDLAAYVGTKPVSPANSSSLRNYEIADLGQARIAVVDRAELNIFGRSNGHDLLATRVKLLDVQISNCNFKIEQEKLKERRGRLLSKIIEIRIGAHTELEMAEKMARAKHALSATRAAKEQGVVPGGGVALIDCQKAIKDLQSLSLEQTAETQIILKALEAPLRSIAANAGAEPHVVMHKVISGPQGFGYDAATRSYVDMLHNGVMDPVKVVRSALENALFVSSNLLITGCAICNTSQTERSN
jgi:chaperonin GroEL